MASPGEKLLGGMIIATVFVLAIQRFYAGFYSSKNDVKISQGEIVDYRELDLDTIQLAPGVRKDQVVDANSLKRQGWQESAGAFISSEHKAVITVQDNRIGQINSARLSYKNQNFGQGVGVSELVSLLGYPHRLLPTLNGVKLSRHLR